MNNQNPAAYENHAHFRVPSDFMSMVHLVARRKGLTAGEFHADGHSGCDTTDPGFR